MMKKFVLCFCITVGCVFSMLSADAFERLNFGDGFISDNANVISLKDKTIINSMAWKLHKNTTADVAIVTVNSLQGQKTEETAYYVAKAFQVGSIGKDNGVVFIIAPNEKKSSIYVGYDLENHIPSLRRQQIQDLFINKAIDDKKTISNAIYKATTVLIADVGDYYNTKIDELDYTLVPKAPVSNAIKFAMFYYILAIILLVITIKLWLYHNKTRNIFNTNFEFGGSIKSVRNW